MTPEGGSRKLAGMSAEENVVGVVDGVALVGYDALLTQMSAAYPELGAAEVEHVALREWEAVTGGRPHVVPSSLIAGIREVLEGAVQRHASGGRQTA